MKVSRLIIYPIKSLRGVDLPSARATKHGFSYDRVFMLLKDEGDVTSDPLKRYVNMQVSSLNQMALFTTAIRCPDDGHEGSLTVTFTPPVGAQKSRSIPLEPHIKGPPVLDVTVYNSSTTGYRMDQQYNDWFSGCFGFDVVLVYLGPSLRPVLFPLAPHNSANGQSWLNYLSGGTFESSPPRSEKITFADMAPYLLVSETSLTAVSERLPTDQPMDVTKFRPNIVVSGADGPWEEDYWAELEFTLKDTRDGFESVTLSLEKNCVRCRSINVDYQTGQQGSNESGRVLATLQKDRRVDTGSKYSPVFGRYSFLSGPEGNITIGDEVDVTKKNRERTVFDWNFG